MAVFEFHTRVAYGDIDEDLSLTLCGAMGMMQEAAIVHSDTIGYSVRQIPQTRLVWMLVQWRIRLMEPAKWNEDVTVRTWPRTMERATSDREFEIIGSDGRQVAIGTSSWVLVNADSGRIIRIPKEVVQAYDLTTDCVFEDKPAEVQPCEGDPAYSFTVRRRDIDTNNHVNNRIYLHYADEALGESTGKFKEVLVRYRKQLLLGQQAQCFVRKDGNRKIVEICSEDGMVCAYIVYQ